MVRIILLSLAVVVPAFAGNGVTGGGDAVVCYKSQARKSIKSVESFDYWEMSRVLPGSGGIKLGDEDLSVDEKIDIALNRLALVDPELAEILQLKIDPILENIDHFLVSEYELPDIIDANPRALPSGNCFIEQYAIQWTIPTSGQRRFVFSQRFYDKANNDHKAGILLHEGIYQWALSKGHKNSDGSRYFNYAISSSIIEKGNFETYVQVYKDANFSDNKCEVIFSKRMEKKVYAIKDWSNRGDLLCISTDLKTKNMELILSRKSTINQSNGLVIPGNNSRLSRLNSLIEWESVKIKKDYPSSMVFQFVISGGAVLQMDRVVNTYRLKNGKYMDISIKYGSSSANCINQISFTKEGDVLKCNVMDEFSFIYNDKEFNVPSGQEVSFSQLGGLLHLYTNEIVRVRVRGTYKEVAVSGRLDFDEEFGLIRASKLASPVVLSLYGKKITIKKAFFNQQGEISLSGISLRFSNPLIGKVPVIATVPGYLAVGACKQIDPLFHAGNIKSKKTQFVLGSQKFYNPGSGQLQTFTDEYVELVTELACYFHGDKKFIRF